MTADWMRLREILESRQRFLLTSHIYPEADSIGSEVALGLYLTRMGKDVVVANETPPLDRYAFLSRLFPIGSLADLGSPDPYRFDAAICLDVCSWDYTGAVGEWIRASGCDVVSIDHHQSHGPFGILDVIDESAASAGEVLYRYLRSVHARITADMAQALYASLLFDTQGFRLCNAGNGTIGTANELVQLGANHREVSKNLFEAESWTRLDLLRLALGTLQRQCGGRLAWLAISEDIFHLAGAEFVDGDGILDHILALEHVEICVMFREMDRRGIKVTFRSKGSHDVGGLAAVLGGGGRSSAAGVLLPTTMHRAIEDVLPRVRAALDPRPRFVAALSPTTL